MVPCVLRAIKESIPEMTNMTEENENQPGEKPAKILVVDDQAIVGAAIRRLLVDESGVEVHVCLEGGEALETALRIQPAVILQDLIMPDVDGMEIVKAYRQEKALKEVPIIVLSSKEDASVKVESFEAGANDYLVKLPESLELIARIRYQMKIYFALKERDEAMRAKSRFLAMMSHEIRTPLNGVLGFSDLLAESDLDEIQLGYVNTIRSSGKALLTVINDILDFSKMEAGKLVLEVEDFDVEKFFRDVAYLFVPMVEGNSNELKFSLSEYVPRRLVGDHMRIRQIVSNLLSNAAKFTHNGQVRLEVKPGQAGELLERTGKKIDVGEKDFLLRISVSDTGIGIPEDKIGHLFEVFDQLHSAKESKYQGTGLGLTICKQLSELMGGGIWLQPGRKAGSEFVCILHLQHALEERKKEDGALLSRTEKTQIENVDLLRVLVVDDSMVNIKLITLLLSKYGVDYTYVMNGKDALEVIQRGEVNLVLMDIQMPEMDGLEVSRRVREWEVMEGRASISIVALTANVMDEDLEECKKAGMDDYLPKPLQQEELVKMLRKVADRYDL